MIPTLSKTLLIALPRAPLLALLGAALLAACAREAPPPPYTAPPASSGATGPSAYGTPPTPPLGAEPAPAPGETAEQAPPTPKPSGGAGPTTGAGGIGLPVTARFVEGKPDLIEVSIRDAQPADQVELVAPSGAATAAFELDRERVTMAPTAPTGVEWGFGITGGSSSGVQPRLGVGIPIFGQPSPPTPREEVLSTARIKVPDMAAYRAQWRHWILRILFGTKGPSPRKMEMAAPAPPAT
ncbi:MAG: hypothetical protein ACOY3L_12480 [Pseudomonadota bacterium]